MNYNFSPLSVNEEKYNAYLFETKDTQLAQLPKKILFCKKCITPNQRPRTDFDAEGICNACRFAEKKFQGGIDWEAREQELVTLLDKYRSHNGSWDVVVPGSGGKDSGMVTHQLKKRYGMHPLTITWAPFIYTDIGWKNYFSIIHSGFDGLIAWPNGILHRKLARIAFELKGDPWEPFAYGQKAYAFHIACKFNIPLIFYGENGEVEYGGSFKNENKSFESPEDWEELYFKGAGIQTMLQEGYKMGILTDEDLRENNFEFYKTPPLESVKKLNLQMHWWSYYKLWVPQENFYYAANNTGFEANTERTEGTYSKAFSIDDRLDPFHWYLGYIKFGYGRATREACSDIRCGHITREEGVALAHRYDHEFPKKYFKEFLEYLSITEEHFWKIVNRYRQPHIWKKEDNGEWKLRVVVSNESLEGEEPKE